MIGPSEVIILKRVVALAIRVILEALAAILSVFVPRSDCLVIFSQSRGRYSGNSRALFESTPVEIKSYWLYTNKKHRREEASARNQQFTSRYTIKGFWLCLRASHTFISHGSGDFGWFWPFAKRSNVINLWHGIGIKAAGLLDRKFDDMSKKAFVCRETRWYNYIICSSEIDRYYTSSYQGISVNRVVVTGLPAADRYLQNRLTQNRGQNIRECKKILYAPTFRDYTIDSPLFFPFNDYSIEGLTGFFKRNASIQISLRPHPNDSASIAYAKLLASHLPGNIEALTVDVLADIDARLCEFDVIVTDYSSIYMLPLLADVPCIFIAHDIDRFLGARGLAYPYILVTPGPKVRSFVQLESSILEAVAGAKGWRENREAVRKMFFAYTDMGNCKRVWKLIDGQQS